jgi:hypothetical protein
MNKKQILIGRLKAQFPKANLSQKRLDAIADKLVLKIPDDAQESVFDEQIKLANDFMDFEAMAKEDDRIRTLEANQKKDIDPDEEKKDAQKPKEATPEEMPAWAKPMFEKLEALEKGNVEKSKRETVEKLFTNSEVLKDLPESLKNSWINRVNINAEDLEAEIKGFETDYMSMKQSLADSTDYASGPSGHPGGIAKVSDDAVNSVLDQM